MHKHDNTTEEEVFEELDEVAATTTQDLGKIPMHHGVQNKVLSLRLGTIFLFLELLERSIINLKLFDNNVFEDNIKLKYCFSK